MSCENCTNCCKSEQPESKPECKVYYALVRIETDTDVNKLTAKIEKLETITGALTLIDVQDLREVTEEAESTGGPVLYWP